MNRFFQDYIFIWLSGMFNRHYYLETYPDVKSAKINPLTHFIKHGWKEGRNPSNLFKTTHYLEHFPEVKTMEINPLIHFIKAQMKEGKKLSSIASNIIGYLYCDLSSPETQIKVKELTSQAPPQSPDVIIFPIIDWDFRFQRPQQLARQFSKNGHRVFYLKIGHFYRSNKAPLIKVLHNNIFEAQLAGGYHLIDCDNALSDENINDLTESIEILIEHLSIKTAIIKVDLPFWSKLAVHLKEKFGWLLMFDCLDFFSGFPPNRPLEVAEEQLLLSESDLVLATAYVLLEHAKDINENTIIVPNATDFEFFHQARRPIYNEEMDRFSHPIIGYYGAISEWFDSHLIAELAADHPEWSFVLVGHTHLADLRPFEDLANVHILGEKPYEALIGYLSNFDVCLIPFKNIPLTNATNPVKLFEYLSAGKPVVATRLNEISQYHDYIRLAETKEEWEMAIQESLSEDKTPELLNQRYHFAQENTWEERGRIIESELKKVCNKFQLPYEIPEPPSNLNHHAN